MVAAIKVGNRSAHMTVKHSIKLSGALNPQTSKHFKTRCFVSKGTSSINPLVLFTGETCLARVNETDNVNVFSFAIRWRNSVCEQDRAMFY